MHKQKTRFQQALEKTWTDWKRNTPEFRHTSKSDTLSTCPSKVQEKPASPQPTVSERKVDTKTQKNVQEIVAALKQCTKTRDLKGGKRIHSDAVAVNCHSDRYVVSSLVTMYSRCGSMLLAREVFDNITYRDVVIWNSLILGYVENGQSLLALELFESMGCKPNSVTYVAALKACAGLANEKEANKQVYLKKGVAIHDQAKQRGFDLDMVVANTLIDMYSKYGSMKLARDMFDRMFRRDVVTWTSLILGYTENGESSVAIELYRSMDCEPNTVTYVAALKACACLASERESHKQFSLENGMVIHKQIKERGLHCNLTVANTLVDMYSKCGSMQCARYVFDQMAYRDVVTWNCLILGYVENRERSIALELFTRMDCTPNTVTFVAALKACAGLATEKESERQAWLEMGMLIHEKIKEHGVDSDIVLATTLIDMYSKCGSMHDARDVFHSMKGRSVVTWNCLISGYSENAQRPVAIDLFTNMDCSPNAGSFVAALKACAGLATEKNADKQSCLHKGVTIHERLKEHGFETSMVVASTLIDMYSKCGSMERAREVFDRMTHKDAVTWTCLILGYVENGESSVAMELFTGMDCAPNATTCVAALKACSGLATGKQLEKQSCLQKGIDIHKQLKERGLDSNASVASSLLDMYSKCGSISHAQGIFDKMVRKDVITWTCLISGYVENGESSTALDLFMSMDCQPASSSYIAALKACGSLTTLPVGKWIHSRVCKHGLEHDELVMTALVDFYGKCGCMAIAEQLFNSIHSHSIVSWTALVAGYSAVGDAYQIFSLVKQIQEAGLQMDSVTLLGVLTVCSHAGMVEEGKMYFEAMCRYGMEPTQEHYACVIDMLGRANRLEEALSVLKSMPIIPNRVAWMSLLGACRQWKNAEVGKAAFDTLVAGDLGDAAAYVMMRDIYRSLSMWQELERMDIAR